MSPGTGAAGERPVALAVSDSTGETAEQVCRAALAQFGAHLTGRVRIFARVRDEEGVRAAVRSAKETGALLAYTLVDPNVRGRMKQVAADEGVPAVDLLSDLIARLARHLGRDPLSLPGLGHQLDAEYFKRMDAVEYAVHHDDGSRTQDLKTADIVILGVSRSSKTPLSSYIAYRGYRVANVPIVRELPLPKELLEVDPRRVFGLVIEPTVLVNIRRARMATFGMSEDSAYGDLAEIRAEIAHARRIYAEHPQWTVIDMTQKAIEETAAMILAKFRERFEPDKAGTPEPLPRALQRGSKRAKKPAKDE